MPEHARICIRTCVDAHMCTAPHLPAAWAPNLPVAWAPHPSADWAPHLPAAWAPHAACVSHARYMRPTCAPT
eukprot:362898-Chlamydomonas_euryale.AAC.4